MSQFRAERTLSSVDACALQSALDSADTRGDPDLHARAERVIASAAAFGRPEMQPGMQADQAIALVAGSRPTPTCLREFSRDQSGTISLPIFLERQHFDRDGRAGGDVVFAREMGPRDSILIPRFGNRVWYRYVVPSDLSDTTAAFKPYEKESTQ